MREREKEKKPTRWSGNTVEAVVLWNKIFRNSIVLKCGRDSIPLRRYVFSARSSLLRGLRLKWYAVRRYISVNNCTTNPNNTSQRIKEEINIVTREKNERNFRSRKGDKRNEYKVYAMYIGVRSAVWFGSRNRAPRRQDNVQQHHLWSRINQGEYWIVLCALRDSITVCVRVVSPIGN